MPKMCGVKALEEMRKEKAFDGIPVIVYTTTESPEQKKQCLKLGAQAFITKSCNYFNVQQFVNEPDACRKGPGRIPGLKNT